jgi:uncharacterized protein YneF (UPF0154 family)
MTNTLIFIIGMALGLLVGLPCGYIVATDGRGNG